MGWTNLKPILNANEGNYLIAEKFEGSVQTEIENEPFP